MSLSIILVIVIALAISAETSLTFYNGTGEYVSEYLMWIFYKRKHNCNSLFSPICSQRIQLQWHHENVPRQIRQSRIYKKSTEKSSIIYRLRKFESLAGIPSTHDSWWSSESNVSVKTLRLGRLGSIFNENTFFNSAQEQYPEIADAHWRLSQHTNDDIPFQCPSEPGPNDKNGSASSGYSMCCRQWVRIASFGSSGFAIEEPVHVPLSKRCWCSLMGCVSLQTSSRCRCHFVRSGAQRTNLGRFHEQQSCQFHRSTRSHGRVREIVWKCVQCVFR